MVWEATVERESSDDGGIARAIGVALEAGVPQMDWLVSRMTSFTDSDG